MASFGHDMHKTALLTNNLEGETDLDKLTRIRRVQRRERRKAHQKKAQAFNGRNSNPSLKPKHPAVDESMTKKEIMTIAEDQGFIGITMKLKKDRMIELYYEMIEA